MTAKANAPTAISALAHAVESFERVVHELKDKKPAVFFDYDGTLTKIVEHPDLAVLSPSMRHSIGRLAGRTLTGIISGLDLDNVRNLVQKDKLLYAGSHGFDMFIPGQGRCEPQPADLERVHAELHKRFQNISGIILEQKRYSLAVQYRQVQDEDQFTVQSQVDDVLRQYPTLRQWGGKKIIEIQPDI
jgi:trehalose-phosphatase